MPGYPVKPHPMSAAELDAYFAGAKIACLRCGHLFRSVGGYHLRLAHSLTCDEYRLMYGIPWSRGLTSEHSKATRSAALKEVVHARLDEWRGHYQAALAAKPPPSESRPMMPGSAERIRRAMAKTREKSPFTKKFRRREAARKLLAGGGFT